MTEPAVQEILRTARRLPDAAALDVSGEVWSYRDLLCAAGALQQKLPVRGDGPQPRIAVMAHREASAYIGILAAQLAGATYIPINVAHPASRSAGILEAAGASHVICGDLAADRLSSILAVGELPNPPEIVPAGEKKDDYDLDGAWPTPAGQTAPDDTAYILFTSGSTGKPKGVPIGHSQLAAYLSAARLLVPELGEGDRFSQCFDLTFDLSVHDVFLSLQLGGTLVVPSRTELENPAHYVRERNVTAWFSVPSLAFQMQLQDNLSPGALPSLRSSLFCGEALPTSLAARWAEAAPNSIVQNWYGPTEATIACMVHPFDPSETDTEVPIGIPFPGMSAFVLDGARAPVDRGELYLAGPQVAQGYLNDPEKTANAFVTLPDGTTAYRTGDLAERRPDGVICFKGRVDNQIKLRGHRIELGEIEAVLRDAANDANTVVLPWPWGETTPRALVAVIEGPFEMETARALIRKRLPEYMHPGEILSLERFPRNASGKADRAGIAAAARDLLENTTTLAKLGNLETRLLRAILTAAPGASAQSILAAETLLEGGVDSLAFVEFTMSLQRDFGVTLSQDEVERMAEMSFTQIAHEVAPKPTGPHAWLAGLKAALTKRFKRQRRSARARTNRALQFIQRFPGILETDNRPLVLVIGSSGVLRAIAPGVIEKVAAAQGQDIRVLNVGLPAITPAGLAMICRFVRDECQKAGATLPLVVYEFDPMHVSTTPPSGDISLEPEFFTRRTEADANTKLAREFEWDPVEGGAWIADENTAAQERRPDWAKKREELIAHAYQGAFTLDETRFQDWQEGARALLQVAERLVCFVHPADPEMLAQKPVAPETDMLSATLTRITDTLGVEVVPWRDLRLTRDEYLNINHANVLGRDSLSRQLAEHLLSPKRR